MNNNLMVKFQDVSKEYRLGTIGGTTLRAELQRTAAKIRHKEDPTKKIGSETLNYGEKFLALDDINFEVYSGETVGIIGHNGAGKSTLLKLISRVTAPTSGEIGINGRIASMLEVGTGFHPELTGRENIYMNGAILGMTRKEINNKIEEIIDFSECRQFIDTPVKRYSSGMYVKLAFSVSAHLDSEIMVMDEVLAVGDMKFQQKCLGRMGDAANQEGRTVLYVSHNMNTIRQLCSRCIVLDHGKLIFSGDVEKAIQLYMDVNEMNFTPYIDFKNIKHLDYCSRKIRLDSACFERDNNIYSYKETMSLELNLSSDEQYEDVRLMWILFYKDGTRVGKSESNNFTVSKGKSIVHVSFPLSGIADGDYYFEINVLHRNDIGAYEKFDGVPETIPFHVANRDVFGIKGEEWKSNYWGHIMLKPMTATVF